MGSRTYALPQQPSSLPFASPPPQEVSWASSLESALFYTTEVLTEFRELTSCGLQIATILPQPLRCNHTWLPFTLLQRQSSGQKDGLAGKKKKTKKNKLSHSLAA